MKINRILYIFMISAILLTAGCNSSGKSESDTKAPSAPVLATAPDVSSGMVSLKWEASTDNIAVTGYRLYRNGVLLVSVSDTVYADTSFSVENNYCYKVSAIDAAGNESALSVETCVNVSMPDTTAPTKPGDVKALSTSVAGFSIKILWSASTDNKQVKGYKILRGGEYLADSSEVSYSDSSVTPGTSYCYTVTAYDEAGNESSASAPVCISAENESNGRIKWSYWTENDISGSIALGSDGTVYAVDVTNLYSLDPDGSLKWKCPHGLEGTLSSPIVSPSGSVYIGTNKGICVIDQNGSVMWRSSTMASPSSIGPYGTCYAEIPSNDVYNPLPTAVAINPDGTVKWTSSDYYWGASAIGFTGTIYGVPTGSALLSSRVWAINPDGSLKWELKSGDYADNENLLIGPHELVFSTTYHYPATGGGVPSGTYLCVADANGTRVGLGSGTKMPSVIDQGGGIYSYSSYKYNDTYRLNIYARDKAGNFKWETASGHFIGYALTVDSGGTLYSTDEDGYLNAIKNGGIRWKSRIGVSYGSPAVADDGTIYAKSSELGIVAIASDSKGISEIGWARGQKNNRNSRAYDYPSYDTEPPSVPSNISGSVTAANVIKLNWEASTDASTLVIGYRIYRNGVYAGMSVSGFTDSGLSLGTEYSYRISAVDCVGHESEQSSEISLSTPAL